MVMGRLRPGTSVSQAQANIAGIACQLEQAYPHTNERIGVSVNSLMQSPYNLKAGMRPALAVLIAAVGVVLLISFANFAHLLLWRGPARRKENTVPTFPRSIPSRLVRPLLT